MTEGKLNQMLQQTFEDKLKAVVDKDSKRVHDDAEVAARVATLLKECKAEVAASILLTIPDSTYKTQLADRFAEDGHKMFAAMRKKHTHEGNETRTDTISDTLGAHIAEGPEALTLGKYAAWCDTFEELNKKLAGTEEHYSDAQYCKKMVKAITDKDPGWGRQLSASYKTEIQAKDPVALREALEASLEANDKAEERKAGKDARTAYATRTQAGDKRIAELTAQVAALKAERSHMCRWDACQ